MRMKIKNRILASVLSFLIIIATAFSGVTTAKAAEGDESTKLADGDYIVNIQEVGNDGAIDNSCNRININSRVVLMARSGKYTIMAKLHGYDQWSTVELFDQSKYSSVTTVKAGTDWTPYDSMTMDGYASEALKSGDETQNSYWSQINKSTTIDKDLNTGIISFSINDITEKFTIGAYAETNKNNKLLSVLMVQSYKIKLETLKNSNTLSYLAYGYDMGTKFTMNAERTIPIATNIQYDNGNTPSGLFESNFVESTELSGGNGKVTALFKVSDAAAEEIESVSLVQSTSLDGALARGVRATTYRGYLLGTYGNVYGDNIYDSEKKQFSISFSGSDGSLSLMTGLDIKIITKENPKGYRALVYLDELGLQMSALQDENTGASYSFFKKYALDAAKISVKEGESADSYPVEQIKQVADGDKWKAYTFDLLDENGNTVIPEKGGYVEIPIPTDWDLDNLYIAYYVGTSRNTDSGGGSTFNNCTNIVEKDGIKYLRYKTLSTNWINNGTIVMCQVLKEANLSELQEDGVYSAQIKFIKADTDSTLSMANGALETSAFITINSGKKDVYMNFHPITMNADTGWYAYLGAIWNITKDDCEEFDYETDSDGKLLDNTGFDALDEFACLKSVKITLSDDTITGNSYTLKVIPPAMGADLSYDEVVNSPIDANLKFYNIKKVDASTVQLPTYQKSVLRRSIDKAERYTESAYSTETWAVLAAALSDGKEYYSSLAGKDAGTDAAISEAIKTKSDAIENAIKALAENSELTAARENLKKAIDDAEKIEQGDKTVSAFNTLADAISEAKSVYERSNVSLNTINTQIETLNKAVETFNSSAAASKFDATKLADGEYKVYVDMKKIDKTTASMSNNAIDHWMNLSVKDGVYTATLDFKGMTISGQFGYLMNLNYYDAGYTYTSTGDPSGTLKAATVLTTQKNDDGSDVIDNFNSADSLYPDTLSFPLVDKGTQEYVPLQVFVPVMENITAGTGTQNVLMKVDWTSLKSADDTTQDVIDMADGLYTVTGELRETDSDAVSAWNSYVDKVRLIAKDGKTTAYIDFKANGKKSVTAVSVDGADAVAVKDGRAVVVLPQNVEYTAVKLTDSTGATGDARLYLALRSAAVQNVNKAALKSYIDKAAALKTDGKAYTDSTLKTLNTALAAAKKVYADEAAIQSEVGAAGLSLKNAVNGMKVKTDISPAVVSGLKNMTYTGKTLTQDKNITVTFNKKTLVQGTDYKVSYKNNKSRGTATVTITGIGNYTGTKTATFKIIQKVTPEVTLSKTAFAYTGKVVTPAVTVKLGGKVVSKTNYTVIMSSGRKSLGTYKVKVSMKGYYSGSKTVTFKIVPKGTSVAKTASGSKSFTVRWGAQKTQTTGYQIQYSTNSKFKSGRTATVSSNKTLTKKVTGLAANKKYYVRVRTYRKVGKTVYYSAWSKAVAVKTK